MKRQVWLYPNETITLSPRKGGVAPGTSGYINSNTPSVRLDEAWADFEDTSHRKENLNNCKGLVGFDPAPTLVLFTGLTMYTAWDYSQNGPNNWYFPPDNSFGPTLTMYMIGRNGSTELDGTSYEIQGADINAMNVNKNVQPGVYKTKAHTWALGTHPEGGPWTFEDINDLQAGVRLNFSAGPSGRAYDPVGFHFHARVVYFRILLDVVDLGGDLDNIRNSSSISLRLYRRPRNIIKPETFVHPAGDGVGSRINFSHRKAPAVTDRGWGRRRLERRAGLILKRTIFPESFRVQDEVLDLHDYACLAWAAYRIDGPWSPELQGLALVEKGNEFTHTRAAQDGWSRRPGDGVLMRVIADYPNLSREGLAAQGGADESVCLRNFDLTQTGWSAVGESGDITVTQDTTVALVEEQGFLSSAKIVYGAAGGAGGRQRSLGALPYASGDFLHLDVAIKNTSVPTPASQKAEWGLYRTGGGLAADEWWDDATRTWTTTISYNEIPSDDPIGEVIVDAIPLDAGGATSDPTYNIRVGRFSSNLSSVTFHAALVDAQHSTSAVAGARTPLVTLDTEITRVADIHKMTNTAAAEIWDYARGVAVVEVSPFWRAVDLPTDAVRPMIHAQHDTLTHDALQFVAKTGSDDLVRFERAVNSETTFQLDVALPSLDITRAHVLRAYARWLGADGWDEFAPYSVEVGYAVFTEAEDGKLTLISSGSSLGALAYTGDVAARDFVGIGTDGVSGHLDGRVRMFETRRNPLHGVECTWRI